MHARSPHTTQSHATYASTHCIDGEEALRPRYPGLVHKVNQADHDRVVQDGIDELAVDDLFVAKVDELVLRNGSPEMTTPAGHVSALAVRLTGHRASAVHLDVLAIVTSIL